MEKKTCCSNKITDLLQRLTSKFEYKIKATTTKLFLISFYVNYIHIYECC